MPLGGDIILSVDGISMDPANSARLRERLSSLRTGAPFTVKLLRAGHVLELTGHAQ